MLIPNVPSLQYYGAKSPYGLQEQTGVGQLLGRVVAGSPNQRAWPGQAACFRAEDDDAGRVVIRIVFHARTNDGAG